MVLIYSIFVIFLISIVAYYYIRKDRQRDKNNLAIDWKNFLKSESQNDIKGIEIYGDKLIWNKYLLNEQLDKIIVVVNSRVTNFPELKKLENNAFNKRLHYNRILP
jgi:hypothetical protein